MDKWNWSAIGTIGTVVIASVVLWNAIDSNVEGLRSELRAVESSLRSEIAGVRDSLGQRIDDIGQRVNDLSQRMTRVETILEERLPRNQEQAGIVAPPQDDNATSSKAE